MDGRPQAKFGVGVFCSGILVVHSPCNLSRALDGEPLDGETREWEGKIQEETRQKKAAVVGADSCIFHEKDRASAVIASVVMFLNVLVLSCWADEVFCTLRIYIYTVIN